MPGDSEGEARGKAPGVADADALVGGGGHGQRSGGAEVTEDVPTHPAVVKARRGAALGS